MILKEDLKKLNVHELRRIAREVGVQSPTTKTCEQMINDIVDIHEGKLKPFKSKMGRPPKASKSNYDKVKEFLNTTSINEISYEPVSKDSVYELSSSVNFAGLESQAYDCLGIVRNIDGEVYIKDYLGNIEYGVLGELKKDVNFGDIIVGKATNYDKLFKRINEYQKFSFKENFNLGNIPKNRVLELKNVNEMHDFIKSQEGNKIIVEVETEKINLGYNFDDTLYFNTYECDDITKSYNMLLDVKSAIKYLCNNQKSFSVYLVDVEYMYAILYTYFEYKKLPPDVNAGQYFKELFSILNKNDNAKTVLLEKENGIRSSYLDIIINKYCENK